MMARFASSPDAERATEPELLSILRGNIELRETADTAHRLFVQTLDASDAGAAYALYRRYGWSRRRLAGALGRSREVTRVFLAREWGRLISVDDDREVQR